MHRYFPHSTSSRDTDTEVCCVLVCVYHGGSRRIYFKFPIFVCHVPSAFFLNFASRKKFNFIRANERSKECSQLGSQNKQKIRQTSKLLAKLNNLFAFVFFSLIFIRKMSKESELKKQLQCSKMQECSLYYIYDIC